MAKSVYLDYFGLNKAPFSISPDPAFLYPSVFHRQALAHLKYGLEREGGFILLTGEVGTGKTTLTRLMLQHLSGSVRVSYILNAQLGELDLIRSICQELGVEIDTHKTNVKDYIDALNKDLLSAHAAGKKTLVVIEEAQNLDPKVLEMLRLLTNLETNTAKLLHILLVGQPELLDVIGRPELRQLNQRVVSRYHLEPLNLEDTSNYIRHRMRRAGCKQVVFDQASVKELHEISGGVPRVINLLSEGCLLGAYSSNDSSVSQAIVEKAAPEVLGDIVRPTQEQTFRMPLVVILCFAIALVAAWVIFDPWDNKSSVKPSDLGTLNSVDQISQEATPAASGTLDRGQKAGEKNAYTQLLSLWSIEESVSRMGDLCSVAANAGLQCITEIELGLDGLIPMFRPGLVRLQETGDRVSIYLMQSIDEGTVTLINAEGPLQLSIDELGNQWDGYFLYLWKPPPGFEGILRIGDKNPELVDWIQNQLAIWNPDYEPVITGGIYSRVISDAVRLYQEDTGLFPDGILGVGTAIQLNDLNGDFPRLHSGQ